MAILTVYTKLLDKTLEGARIIDMGSTKTCQCYVLPYDKVAKVGKDYLQSKYAFYLLLGTDELGHPMAYVGQTNDFTVRCNDHKQKKDWWDTALVFVSKADEIFASEVLYLEYIGWKEACERKNYKIANTKTIKEPGLSDDKKNDMELFFEEIKFLTRFYGCGIFDVPVAKPQSKHLFYVRATDRPAEGIGYYDENAKQFVLVKGCIIANGVVASYKPKTAHEKFIKEYCKTDKGQIVLQSDVPIERPSGASGIVLGRPSNGWDDWKDSDGNKLGNIVKR